MIFQAFGPAEQSAMLQPPLGSIEIQGWSRATQHADLARLRAAGSGASMVGAPVGRLRRDSDDFPRLGRDVSDG